METIINYLENVFATLPKTPQLLNARQDLQTNMLEKYQELKESGKSENEAVGQVIAEFGNIEELLESIGFEHINDDSNVQIVDIEEAKNYIKAKNQSSILNGIGVFLCIIGASMLISADEILSFSSWSNLDFGYGAGLGIIPLLVLVAIAVGLFIFGGVLMEKYKYLENNFSLSEKAQKYVLDQKAKYTPLHTLLIIIGVMLCILSPIPLFISSTITNDYSTLGISILLVIVSIAVLFFIIGGSRQEAYKQLLQIDEYKPQKSENKTLGVVASIIWPLAVIIFLCLGFIFDLWHISWIVFPITGILYGMFCAVYSAVTKD